MAARLIGLVLGLLIAAAGWIVVRPLVGDIGPAVPGLDLGDFEGLRALIGWGALALGGLAVVVNLWPARGGGRSRSASQGRQITFADDPPVATPVAAPVAMPAPAPRPAPAPAPA
ncbi:MAG: hypothetical protein Q7T61_00555, partial [Caulobacter sp.]|nr:hypothetical protein [Caulobacter sp.]